MTPLLVTAALVRCGIDLDAKPVMMMQSRLFLADNDARRIA